METKRVIAVVSDLMFVVKIGDAAKRAGVAVKFVSDAPRVLEMAEGAALVLIDLNNDKAQPLELVRELKARRLPVIGYLSHVQLDLKRQAEEAGCDRVIARSTLSDRINEIMSSLP